MNTYRVWIVFNPQTLHVRPPTCLHQTLETAENEAERLARENPGQAFHVMVSVCAKFKADVSTIAFDDDPSSQGGGIPF